MKVIIINILDSNDMPGGIDQYHPTPKWPDPYQLKYLNPGSQIPPTSSRKSPSREDKHARSRHDVAIQRSKLSNSMATLHDIKIPLCQCAPSRLSPNHHWDGHATNC
ncbi:hypothetical protein ACN38_g4473 [Penicillium nordicum]|uniref:Uncharacterized protein n=1 Tax=Penicillium nordicum TaxID=229535 RepID=A0A0M8P3A4_9EURO|nr:hypothetical protein ACN38_g4473 [Penicillium nordicum]